MLLGKRSCDHGGEKIEDATHVGDDALGVAGFLAALGDPCFGDEGESILEVEAGGSIAAGVRGGLGRGMGAVDEVEGGFVHGG